NTSHHLLYVKGGCIANNIQLPIGAAVVLIHVGISRNPHKA
ncbi:MAG: hypothetical protein ACI9N3_000548, partial [Colwellia sp.]